MNNDEYAVADVHQVVLNENGRESLSNGLEVVCNPKDDKTVITVKNNIMVECINNNGDVRKIVVLDSNADVIFEMTKQEDIEKCIKNNSGHMITTDLDLDELIEKIKKGEISIGQLFFGTNSKQDNETKRIPEDMYKD